MLVLKLTKVNMQKKTKESKTKKVRLDSSIIPISYDIELKPDLNNFTFEGVETISVENLKDTKKVVLHSKELEIDTVSVSINKEKVFAKIFYDENAETATFVFPKVLKKGKHKITIYFKGILNDKMRGFYKSTYEVDGKKHHLATTQFEATDARRAFPCFDEPSQKAIFNVSLIIPKDKHAISNTLPVSVAEHEAGYQIIKYAPTPKMSTYLLAFIVGDFEYIEAKTKNGVLVRVYTTKGKIHQAKFALECGVKALEFYEDYFEIKYPLNTLDMIAIPDFSAAGMENWGSIIYRESALLVDEKHTATANKQWVALVIAHEIAHQWFGNLVTMEWWTHLWLNEGFASYIEFLAVDKIFPEWDIWTQFSTHDFSTAIGLDSLSNTHPIEIKVHHPNEIGEIFDEISYSKGACVIKMLAEYLGEENFRLGLSHYLKKHSYKNTETEDLWEAFEKISKKPVVPVMKNWTSRPGYPVLILGEKKDKLEIAQKRFFRNPLSEKSSKDKAIWQVPITVAGPEFKEKFLLKKSKEQFSDIDFSSWFKVNFEESGFYRVAYTDEMLNKLKKAVSEKEISARDRLGIIRDLFDLAEAGYFSVVSAMKFVEAYQKEDDYTVWAEIVMRLSKIKQMIAKTKIEKDFDKFIIKTFLPIHQKLGFEKQKGEKHTDALLRSLVIGKLVDAGEKTVIKSCLEIFEKMQKGTHIDPDLKNVCYKTYAKMGGEKEYQKMLELYQKAHMHEEKNRIGYQLSAFQNVNILKKVCEFSISENVRKQDTTFMLGYVVKNPLGRDVWFDFVFKNWKLLVDRYGDGGYTLSRFLKFASGTPEKKHLVMFTKFFTKNPAPSAERAVEQIKESIETNVLWLKRDYKKLEKFLKNN